MLTNMKNIALAAGVSVIALSSSAFAQDKIMVSKIDVESSVSAAAESGTAGCASNGKKSSCRKARGWCWGCPSRWW